jgi:hypothetical protein
MLFSLKIIFNTMCSRFFSREGIGVALSIQPRGNGILIEGALQGSDLFICRNFLAALGKRTEFWY